MSTDLATEGTTQGSEDAEGTEIAWNPSHIVTRLGCWAALMQNVFCGLGVLAAFVMSILAVWSRDPAESHASASGLLVVATILGLFLWGGPTAVLSYWVDAPEHRLGKILRFWWSRARWTAISWATIFLLSFAMCLRATGAVLVLETIVIGLLFFALSKSRKSWRLLRLDGTTRALHPHPDTEQAPEIERERFTTRYTSLWDEPNTIHDSEIAYQYAESASAASTTRRVVTDVVKAISGSLLVAGVLWYFNEMPAGNFLAMLGVAPIALYGMASFVAANAGRYDDLEHEYRSRATELRSAAEVSVTL